MHQEPDHEPVANDFHTTNLASTTNVTNNALVHAGKRSLSPGGNIIAPLSPPLPDDNPVSMWASGQSVLETNGVGRMTLTEPDQYFDWDIRSVSNAWIRQPQTHRARVFVSDLESALTKNLASTLGQLRDVFLDSNGVPNRVYLSQMHPFVEDGSTKCTFRDRLSLDVLGSLSDSSPLGNVCNGVLDHVRDIFVSLGLEKVYSATRLHHMQVVCSFHNAHCQVPLTWDDDRSLNTIIVAIPLNACGALRYVSPAQVDVYGNRENFGPEVNVGQVVISIGVPLYLTRYRCVDRNLLVTSVLFMVLSTRSTPFTTFTKPCFRAADDLEGATGVPPTQVCVCCNGLIRDRRTDDLWGNKSVDVGKGFHCSHCREIFKVPGFMCSECRALNPCARFSDSAVERLRNVTLGNNCDDPLSEFVNGWLAWEVSALQLRSNKLPCLHVYSAAPNDLGGALLNVMSLDEIKKGAQMFCRWYREGAILFEISPSELRKWYYEYSDHSYLWPKWRQLYMRNSHCSRAVLAFNALIGALQIGPLHRGFDASGKPRRVTKQQPPFYITLEDYEKIDDLRSRLWIAERMSRGLITKTQMQQMSLKVLRHIQKGCWTINFKCTCSIKSANVLKSTRWDWQQCVGPILDVSLDHDVQADNRLQALVSQVRSTQAGWVYEMETSKAFAEFLQPGSNDYRFW